MAFKKYIISYWDKIWICFSIFWTLWLYSAEKMWYLNILSIIKNENIYYVFIVFLWILFWFLLKTYYNLENSNNPNTQIIYESKQKIINTPNWDFWPYDEYLDFFNYYWRKFECKSSFNNNTEFFINLTNLWIWIWTRLNLAWIKQFFIDIINTDSYIKNRIFIKELSLVYNQDNFVFINYLSTEHIWTTTKIDINNMQIISETQEFLAAYLYIIYNVLEKKYYKLNSNNIWFTLWKELWDLRNKEISKFSKNAILFKTENNKVDIYAKSGFIYENIFTNCHIIWLSTKDFYDINWGLIYLFNDSLFETYFDFYKSDLFSKNIDKKLAELKQKEIKEKDDEFYQYISLMIFLFVWFLILLLTWLI